MHRRLAAQLSALRCDASPAPAAAAEPDDEGPVTAAVRRQYDEQGFVVIDGLVSEELAARLLSATERVTAATRAVGGAAGEGGGGGLLRELGNFTTSGPPGEGVDFTRHNPHGYLHTRGEPWNINGVMHPQLDEPAFLEFLASPSIVAAASAFLRGAGPLMLGDCAPFVNPQEADFSIGWHRVSSTDHSLAQSSSLTNAAPHVPIARLRKHRR